MEKYDFNKIEDKWIKYWNETKPYAAVDFHPTKKKYYVLYEFFNVSGNLHMGHLKGAIPGDVLARFKRFNGYNVLFPMGGDAFGMPAENAAMKYGTDPHEFVRKGYENIVNQCKAIGLSFDYDRGFCTSDEDYYKWTQWIFLQLFKHGKAYKTKGVVNFCPNCKTTLSNEDSQNGKCDRCGTDVVQVNRWVWYLKMKEYAEKLLVNTDHIDMAEGLKSAQRNWIGRSEGMDVDFKLVSNDGEDLGKITIYTTCVETIYGVTFLAVAPELELLDKLKDKIKNFDEVIAYRKKTALRKEFDRKTDNKEKTGVKLDGIFAINPLTGAKVPVYSADFVLANHGTGAVMAVPTHDQRDYDFAKAFGIDFIQVIEGDVSQKAVEKGEYLSKNSKMLNSQEFDGMPVKEAKKKIADKVESLGVGKRKVDYAISDWAFNRQRYWGEPFPVVICDKCGIVPMREEDLPLILPKTNDFTPNEEGDGPLSKVTSWVNTTCPNCGGKARHETDIMPNWAGSSWYWLRFMDPHNDKALADPEKLKYWGQVDCYMGGNEHVCRHILYAYFWQNFLYEIGVVPSRDPFAKKVGNGLVLDDTGRKMSKSSKNGVNPLQVSQKYGADATRLHVQFLGAYEDNIPWTFDGITGITSFLDKVWALQDMIKGDEVSKEHKIELNKLIKKVTEDYETLKLNTAISAFMIFIKKIREDGFITKEELKTFLILLNPLAPFITSEEFEAVFKSQILNESWPKYDERFLQDDSVKLPIQINGKLSKIIEVKRDISQEELLQEIEKTYPEIYTKDKVLKKIVFVPNRIINLIV